MIWLLFTSLILFGGSATSCTRYVSSCDTSKNYASQALDIVRDDDHRIIRITRYFGVSLLNTCYYPQDYFHAVEMNVTDYTVDSNGGVVAEGEVTDDYFIIENVSYMRSKRLKCSSRLSSSVRYPLSWNCTDGSGRVVTEIVESLNGTFQTVEIESRNGSYVIDGDILLPVRCYDCQCSISSSSGAFLYLMLLTVAFALVLFLLDWVINFFITKYRNKKDYLCLLAVIFI